jgi:hypothetical protein
MQVVHVMIKRVTIILFDTKRGVMFRVVEVLKNNEKIFATTSTTLTVHVVVSCAVRTSITLNIWFNADVRGNKTRPVSSCFFFKVPTTCYGYFFKVPTTSGEQKHRRKQRTTRHSSYLGISNLFQPTRQRLPVQFAPDKSLAR